MTYEQKLERERKIRLAIRKVRDERKQAQAQRYKMLRDKWGCDEKATKLQTNDSARCV